MQSIYDDVINLHFPTWISFGWLVCWFYKPHYVSLGNAFQWTSLCIIGDLCITGNDSALKFVSLCCKPHYAMNCEHAFKICIIAFGVCKNSTRLTQLCIFWMHVHNAWCRNVLQHTQWNIKHTIIFNARTKGYISFYMKSTCHHVYT